ncbi:Pentatricopeptide repeat-containing protein [Heracleum sosnowskyi]|uniref:Pentatricopeptide repeat-containing protein n=1 Tax=Heracleum sosnowskyi TaxID=360622 RepID=A0AAD8HSG5_9APIA|nr:Pentatricopeptide repeat-containing protein [Heracleum sosnowskyi]
MISGYVRYDQLNEGLMLFSVMMEKSGIVGSNKFIVSSTYQSAEYLGKQVHGYMIKIRCDQEPGASNSLNGQPHEALQLFRLLLKSGNKPDHITFIGVLSACTHAGLIDEGLEYFHSIKEKHGLEYIEHHYGCVIDLLGRSGRFKEAEDFILSMPMKPSECHWSSLLNGCRIHGNIELAKRSAEAVFQIEPDSAANMSLDFGRRMFD